ncbi:MAG: hypothetical protein LC753_02815 [Acidobacteria bacterium]|nr:hypothetical protein [Acidobacteriota bacterium]MCA1649233.1 hypothetical protein [Acidobacteriota bacterium]
MRGIRGQHQVERRLAFLELERRQLVLLSLRVRLLLLRFLLAKVLDEFFLLVADELLAVGQPWLRSPRADVSELCDEGAGAGIDRNHEQVAVAYVGHVRVVPRPPRTRFRPRGTSDLTACAGAVNQDHVPSVYKKDPLARFVPTPARRWNILRLIIGELAGLSSITGDRITGRVVFAWLAPVEIQLTGVGRPAQTGRRRADEVRAAHDAVDGQLEPARLLDSTALLRDGSGGRDTQQGQRECNTESAHGRLILGWQGGPEP